MGLFFYFLKNYCDIISYMRNLNKLKPPEWFKDLYSQIDKERKDLFEYFSEIIGYGPEWCGQNVEKCLERLKPREREWAIEQLNKIDVMAQYVWSHFIMKTGTKLNIRL